ncbi:MAG: tetratricopeptide repeat protein [Bacteroidia bacterium]
MLKIRFCIIFILILSSGKSFAQNKADSMIALLSSQKEDTNKVKLLNDISWEYYATESNTSMNYAKQALKLAENLDFKYGIATALNTIGIAHYFKGHYPDALNSYIRGTRILESMNPPALKKLSALYNNIATVLIELRRYKDAELYFRKSLKVDGDAGDKLGMAQSYNNIGLIYKELNKYDSALSYYFKAYGLRKEINDKQGMPSTLTNIGVSYVLTHKADLGQRYLNQALQLYRENKDTMGLAIAMNSFGDLYEENQQFDVAIKYYDSSLAISKQQSLLSYISYSYYSMAGVYGKKKDFENAFKFQKMYMRYKDSIYNKESAEQVAEMQTKYETEKKEKELLKTKAESEKQMVLRNAFIAGFIFMLALAFFIFRGYRNKQRLNIEIMAQKNKVEIQRDLIEEKQKEILDSIHYAKRIQQSLMPTEMSIEKSIKRLRRS